MLSNLVWLQQGLPGSWILWDMRGSDIELRIGTAAISDTAPLHASGVCEGTLISATVKQAAVNRWKAKAAFVFIWGGKQCTNPNTFTDQLEVLNATAELAIPRRGTETSGGPPRRAAACGVCVNDHVYLIGGECRLLFAAGCYPHLRCSPLCTLFAAVLPVHFR